MNTNVTGLRRFPNIFAPRSSKNLSCCYPLVSSRRVPMCQGFSNFSGFLHHFVLAKLVISSIRVNDTGVKIKNLLHEGLQKVPVLSCLAG